MMQFAEKLKNQRAKTGLTQNQIADLLDIERSTYAKYECGAAKPPIDILYRISVVYNASADELIRPIDILSPSNSVDIRRSKGQY